MRRHGMSDDLGTVRVRFGVVQRRGRVLGVKPHCINGRELPQWQQGPDLKTYVRQLQAEDLYLVGYRAGEYVFERCDDILET
jgi:hypothetical protein